MLDVHTVPGCLVYCLQQRMHNLEHEHTIGLPSEPMHHWARPVRSRAQAEFRL